jgi:hypothetical protein
MGLWDILDLTDFVLRDTPGDLGRCTGRMDVRGGAGSNSSSISGVRERPSESLKLFSLGMVVLLVLVVVVDVGGEAVERLVFGSPLATPRPSNSLRAFIRNVDLFCRRAPATAKPTPGLNYG